MRVVFSVGFMLFLTSVLAAQDVQVVQIGGEGKHLQLQVAVGKPDFGPLEDGKEKSHEKLIQKGWIYLFDSRTPRNEKHNWDPLSLWRVRNPDRPQRNHWKVTTEKGERILVNDVGGGHGGGTDLISLQESWDFDVHVELRASSNSGIYLRGRYEIQINDTPADPEMKVGAGGLGGIYSVSGPSKNASKGPGVWQTIDASIRGYTITVYLNGVLIQDKVEIPKEKRRGTGSQLGEGDGVSSDPASPGPIFLQGDHGRVECRNIRIRPRRGPMPVLRAQPKVLRTPERPVRVQVKKD